MADLVKLKRSAVAAKVPLTTDLALGELAVNTNDGKLFLKKDDGAESIVEMSVVGHTHSGVYQPLDAQLTDVAALTPTKGTVIVGNGTNFVNLGVGTNDQVLTADSAQTTGVKWGTAAGGGATGYLYSGTITTAPVATGEDTLVIGDGALAGANINAIVIGTEAKCGKNDGDTGVIVIGKGAGVTSAQSSLGVSSMIAIGSGAGVYDGGYTQVFQPLAIGVNAKGAKYSVAVGTGAVTRSSSDSGYSVAIGPYAETFGGYSVAIGSGSVAGNTSIPTSNTAVGRNAKASFTSGHSGNSTAIGYNCTASSPGGSCTSVGVGCGTSASISVAMGYQQNMFANYGVIIGSSSSSDSGGTYSITINSNVYNQNGFSSAVIIGNSGKTEFAGQCSLNSGSFTNARGLSQQSLFSMLAETTTATATELRVAEGMNSAPTTNRPTMSNNSTYLYDVDLVARNTTTTGENSAWSIKFCMKRDATAGTSALVGSVSSTLIGQDAGASAWTVAVTADTTNGCPVITVTGEASKTIRWVAGVKSTRVGA